MLALAKKLAITATDDGILIRPTGTRDLRRDVRISYETKKISIFSRTEGDDASASALEAHGVFGLLDLVETAHLIVITRREHIASIRGKAIYTVRDVTLIPLTSQAEAQKAIDGARTRLNKASGVAAGDEIEDSDVDDEADTASVHVDIEQGEKDAAALEPPKGPLKKSTTFAKDAILERGKGYGRFAKRWFSRNNSKGDVTTKKESREDELQHQYPKPAPSVSSNEPAINTAMDTPAGKTDTETADDEEQSTADASNTKSTIATLQPRILRTARLYFNTSGFFFSYDHDLSASLTQPSEITSDSPLWKRFNGQYFWNKHLADAFIAAGVEELVLPFMQGFIGQRTFSIAKTDAGEPDAVGGASQSPEDVVAAQATPANKELSDDGHEKKEFVLTLISRRSVKRAGLRYLRRGVDDDGNTANTVETEQILSPMTWDTSEKMFSLIQLRGSIPLHFTQNPGTLKPTPIMFGSEATNQAAFRTHLSNVAKRYNDIQIVSLIDKHPPEVSIGEAFEHHSKMLNESGGIGGRPVGFEWFDFHNICKGMKFENVSILMDSIEDKLKTFGWITKQDDRNIGLQTGVVRTNCMDCLDRTNVVQAAIASWALEKQLTSLGLQVDLKKDPKTQWFNTLWADNGDAISRQYAGSAAMKGDFTRTRKRTWAGALSDFTLTMTRYYNSIFGDYWLQLNIDYFLGNTGPGVFDEFETEMMSKDYNLDIARIRQNAIDLCIKIVLEDPQEHLLGGWTLSCPKESNTLRTLPFEECVVLLTEVALYFCRFEWETDKVGSFEKVDLRDVKEIWRGAYITSGLGETHLDEARNYGFALRYTATEKSVIRTNTRSLQNEGEQEDGSKERDKDEKEEEEDKEKKKGAEDNTKLLAFKALPPSASASKDNSGNDDASEVQAISKICAQLQHAAGVAQLHEASKDGETGKVGPQVEERDVISIADAKKSTGYVESIGYSLKRLVWS